MKEIALGIDIGGTNTVYGLVDRNGECIAEDTMPTQAYESFDEYLKNLTDKMKEMLNRFSDISLSGIGIGAPNGNYYSGTIEYAPNLKKWWGVIKVTESIKKYFPDTFSLLTNDANAAAIGEMVYGGAKNMKNFIIITLGTGVGSGLVVNGELVYGHDGFAGEIGHAITVPNGRDCGCGRKGCLETYASANGIRRTVAELLALRTHDSELRDVTFNNLTAKLITDAALRGDKIALESYQITGDILGKQLADTVAHTSPEAYFLFGGLANAGELIFKPTYESMERNLLNVFKNKVKLLPSRVPESNAAVLGASALVWKELAKR